MRVSHTLVAILMTILISLPVMGTSVIIQQPEAVVKEATLIVDMVVKDIKSTTIPNQSRGDAWIILSVVDKNVGDRPSEFAIRRSQVTSGPQFFETEWDLPYHVGEHFMICLFPTPDGYRTMGL